ncbi:hypothetical protein ACH41H_47390 [Streptomyces sp. NPDC020800]|uniref:hypothetical protein n=1 Tax=Streptomyces sp. NPDC020800 TaxID=3365092 RepID=UPI0037A6F483
MIIPTWSRKIAPRRPDHPYILRDSEARCPIPGSAEAKESVMNDRAFVFVQGNKAEIYLPAGVTVQVKAKANSKTTQKVALTSKDGTVANSPS